METARQRSVPEALGSRDDALAGEGPRRASLAEGYRGAPGAFDEVLDGGGSMRPPWTALIDGLDALPPAERQARWESVRRSLRENGVTYNVYGDPQGAARPWPLDPVPLLLSTDDWRVLEAGLQQRAQLLDAILDDLQGPRRLLTEGLLPPELVFANPGFQLAYHGLPGAGRRRLVLYSADFGRAPDGSWVVLADRSQAPSGAGYALENRIVLADALAEPFAALRVRRLARFFAALRATLAALAPRPREEPRVVLLTPGPLNETYFEHAFLARYLGYTLVEGADLTVREGGVYLKVLGGLQRIDVILRRLDDDFCDPLELRSDSSLGVPGLLQAVRAGNVAVANPLGSSLVEMPALLAFLPGICRALLDEDLRLSSCVSWWCGEQRVLEHVIASLDRMVVKPAFPALAREPVFGRLLDAEKKEALVRRMRARPHEYVGQEELVLSSAPILDGDCLRPRHASTRAFLVASGDGYEVMPGGLTRVAASEATLVVSMQRGGGCKDTWVLSSEPVERATLLAPPGQPVALTRGGKDLPSRTADDLFWLGRYSERCAYLIRLLRATLRRLADPQLATGPELPAVLRALAAATETQLAPPAVDSPLETNRVIAAVLADAIGESPTAGLRGTVAALGRAASAVRGRLSADAWRILTRLESELGALPGASRRRPAEARARVRPIAERLEELFVRLSAFDGIVMESMTRGDGWRFLEMGRRVERAMHLAALVRATLVEPGASPGAGEASALEALLELADSLMTYRRRYSSRLQPHAALDLLLSDETNPRSLVFQLAMLEEHVRALPREAPAVGPSPEERLAIEMRTAVQLADPLRVSAVDAAGRRSDLDRLLERVGAQLPALSELISQSYLSHAQLPRQLGRLEAVPAPAEGAA